MNAILPLYPDVDNKPHKRYPLFVCAILSILCHIYILHLFYAAYARVIVKVDSGSGRTNIEMLAYFCTVGIYCVPGVPNTTHISQEIYQRYVLFKTVFQTNIEVL